MLLLTWKRIGGEASRAAFARYQGERMERAQHGAVLRRDGRARAVACLVRQGRAAVRAANRGVFDLPHPGAARQADREAHQDQARVRRPRRHHNAARGRVPRLVDGGREAGQGVRRVLHAPAGIHGGAVQQPACVRREQQGGICLAAVRVPH